MGKSCAGGCWTSSAAGPRRTTPWRTSPPTASWTPPRPSTTPPGRTWTWTWCSGGSTAARAPWGSRCCTPSSTGSRPRPAGRSSSPTWRPAPRSGRPCGSSWPGWGSAGAATACRNFSSPRWSASSPWRPSTRCWPGCPWPVWRWFPSSPGWEAGCSWFLCAGTWPYTTWASAGSRGTWTPWGPSSPCSPPAGSWKTPSPSPPSGRSCAPPSPPSVPCWAGCRGWGSPAGRTGSCAGSISGCSPSGTCGCTAKPKSSWPPIPSSCERCLSLWARWTWRWPSCPSGPPCPSGAGRCFGRRTPTTSPACSTPCCGSPWPTAAALQKTCSSPGPTPRGSPPS